MKEYWHIVPVNDGCTVLAFDAGFYLVRKEDASKNEDILVFPFEDEAQEFIKNNLPIQQYKPEEFWILRANKEVQNYV